MNCQRGSSFPVCATTGVEALRGSSSGMRHEGLGFRV